MACSSGSDDGNNGGDVDGALDGYGGSGILDYHYVCWDSEPKLGSFLWVDSLGRVNNSLGRPVELTRSQSKSISEVLTACFSLNS